MHPYDEAVDFIIAKNDTMNANDWLKSMGKSYGVIHELTNQESHEICNLAIELGALEVQVVGDISLDDKTQNSIDMLLIKLPNDPSKRIALFELEARVAEEVGFMPSVDEGQNSILLRWS